MAQHTIVQYVDDLDGAEAAGTVDFGLDGKNYEIDLSDSNAEALRAALAPYVAAARRSSAGPVRRSASNPGTSAADREKNAQIRAWLRENGHRVPDRGRISQAHLDAYRQGISAAPEPSVDEEPKRRRSRNKVEDSNVVQFKSAEGAAS